MLTAPPPADYTEGPFQDAQREGSELLFYWSTIVIRLCFGSFIVAILVGSLNKVMVSEKTESAIVERDASLPDGFVSASTVSWSLRATIFSRYLAFTTLYGLRGPTLVRRLEHQVDQMEEADVSGHLEFEQLMVPAPTLVELVGPSSAMQLLEAYGARRAREGDALALALEA